MRKEKFLQKLEEYTIGKRPVIYKERKVHPNYTYSIPLCSYGDYDNSSDTERVNNRVANEAFKRVEWVSNTRFSYNTVIWGFDSIDLPKRSTYFTLFLEMVESLSQYSILEDFAGIDYSTIEAEVKEDLWDEAWGSWLKLDVESKLSEYDEGIDLDDFQDEDEEWETASWWFAVFCETSSGGGWWIGSGGSVDIDDYDNKVDEFCRLLVAYQDDSVAIELELDKITGHYRKGQDTKRRVLLVSHKDIPNFDANEFATMFNRTRQYSGMFAFLVEKTLKETGDNQSKAAAIIKSGSAIVKGPNVLIKYMED